MAHWHSLLLTFCFIQVCMSSLDQAGEQALENVLQQILQIKPGADTPERPPEPPKHMLELYQSYVKDAGPLKNHWGQRGGSGISMVRSILPTAGVSNNMLVFNLSAVRPRETVLEAQLHLHRKRLPRPTGRSRQELPPPYRVRLLQAATSTKPSRPLFSILVSPNSRGWHSHTITDAVQACRRCFLEVRFEEPKSRGGNKILPATNFIHENGAFLLLFSEDEYKPITDTETSNNLANLIVRAKRSLSDDGVKESTQNFIDDDSRSRRSIYDNELPDETPTSPVPISQSRRRPSTRPHDETNTIPYPHSIRGREGARRRGGSRKSRRRGHRKNDRKLLPDIQESGRGKGTTSTMSPLEGTNGECHVNRLSVNLEDVGWQDWVLMPKAIDINYCAGTCDLSQRQNLAANNHAVFQGFLHKRRFDVPALCCVSDQLSSVNVMMLEGKYSVVIRVYRNMTVQSCRCR